jgi:ATP/maltotriose-dependent transcriptional regulator MalT
VKHNTPPAWMSDHCLDGTSVNRSVNQEEHEHSRMYEAKEGSALDPMAGARFCVPESDSVIDVIGELASALSAIAVEPDLSLPAAIRAGRERLRAIELAEATKTQAASATLLDACGLLLDRLNDMARALESSSFEAARRERLRIMQVLTQLEDAANPLSLRPRPPDQSPQFTPAVTPTVHGESALVHPLTAQEQTVLELLATGAGTQHIAEALTISPMTVKKHVSNLLAKLAVSDRLSAVLRGQALGLLPPVLPTSSRSVQR